MSENEVKNASNEGENLENNEKEANFSQNNEKNAENEQKNSLDQKIVELEEKLSQANDKILRALADSENMRRRAREELEKTQKYAITNFASDLVLAVENFFLACDNLPQSEIDKSSDVKHFADAVIMTKKELMKILEKNQVKRIYPLNEKFDHNFHEAISQIESEAEEGSVVKVVQAGYLIGDRVMRPALVCVARPKE